MAIKLEGKILFKEVLCTKEHSISPERLIYLKGREIVGGQSWSSSTHWFTPWMVTMAVIGPGKSQECGTPLGFLIGWQWLKDLGLHPLLFQVHWQ